MGNINYKNVIRSTSYNQHEILADIIKMHNGGQPFECDITYSTGKFYGKYKVHTIDGETTDIEIPQPKYKFDVDPKTDDTVKIEPFGKLPIDDGIVGSVVADLPFVVSPHKAPSVLNDDGTDKKKNIIYNRFSSYYPWWAMPQSYDHWMHECYRVLKDGGILVWKTQSTISGGKNIMMPYFSWMIAEMCGFYTLDEFIILAKNRLHSGKIKAQQHARKFHSHFFVFKKSKRQPPINYFLWMDKEANDNE